MMRPLNGSSFAPMRLASTRRVGSWVTRKKRAKLMRTGSQNNQSLIASKKRSEQSQFGRLQVQPEEERYAHLVVALLGHLLRVVTVPGNLPLGQADGLSGSGSCPVARLLLLLLLVRLSSGRRARANRPGRELEVRLERRRSRDDRIVVRRLQALEGRLLRRRGNLLGRVGRRGSSSGRRRDVGRNVGGKGTLTKDAESDILGVLDTAGELEPDDLESEFEPVSDGNDSQQNTFEGDVVGRYAQRLVRAILVRE